MVDGPSEATYKTGKYLQSILDQLRRALGVHAMVVVAYKDETGAVKISEYIHCSEFTLASSNACIGSKHRG